MRFIPLRVVTYCFLLALLAMPDLSAASADNTDPAVTRQKINLSGRQRMLSQRMAAASCLAMAGIDRDARAQVAQTAHDDFAKALNGLKNGDTDLGLPAETNADITSAFDEVAAIWSVMSPAVRQLSAGDTHSVVVNQLMTQNLPLLAQSNAAVQQITQVYGGGVINTKTAKTIDVAGRQRMLSQKMMKEACFVAGGLSAQENSKNLSASMNLFHDSLEHLINGNIAIGIQEPPSQEVKRQLEKVATYWDAYRTGLSLIEPGSVSSNAELSYLAELSDTVLKEMHKAVLFYVSEPG